MTKGRHVFEGTCKSTQGDCPVRIVSLEKKKKKGFQCPVCGLVRRASRKGLAIRVHIETADRIRSLENPRVAGKKSDGGVEVGQRIDKKKVHFIPAEKETKLHPS